MQNVLQMQGISKIYGNGIYANKNISFSVAEGEIHAIVGENGAGKSTLMKILYGLEKPDHGQIILRDKPASFQSPQDAMIQGIGMVHQHFMLVGSLTVVENITLGYEPVHGIFVDRKKARKIVEVLLESFGLKISPDIQAKDLSVGIKQKIEILKALYRGARILILDEPTAVLTPQETEELFLQLKNLRDKGLTVIFISHKLREVKEISDRISVMRKGEMITTVDTDSVSEQEISNLMIGSGFLGKIEKRETVPGSTILKVKDLHWQNSDKKSLVKGVTFDLHAGEILGIAGVEGNGQDELIRMIVGLTRPDKGEISMFGLSTKHVNIRNLRKRGMSYIPSDRMTMGIAESMSIENNLISTKIQDPLLSKWKLLNNKKISVLSENLVQDFKIKCGSAKTEVSMLSGGNIQKVVVAREFTQGGQLIVAEQPTRGIDVGAALFIHQKLVEMRDQGCAVLLVSADLEELTKLSDRMIVMYNGEISAHITDVPVISEIELGQYMLGVKTQITEQR